MKLLSTEWYMLKDQATYCRILLNVESQQNLAISKTVFFSQEKYFKNAWCHATKFHCHSFLFNDCYSQGYSYMEPYYHRYWFHNVSGKIKHEQIDK